MTIALLPESHLRVWTYKAGLLSKVAHDLCIEARDFSAPLTLHEGGRFAVEVGARADGLFVLGQVKRGSITPLKPKDHAEIEGNIRGAKVLDAARYPEIRFVAEGDELVSGSLPGTLTLHGCERPVTVAITVARDGRKVSVDGEVRFLQSTFGIKPYSALMGALKIKDEVRLSWRLRYEGPA